MKASLADAPLVKIQGVADLSPDLKRQSLPIWFDAKIQFEPDGSFEITEFLPTYGQVQGALNDRLFSLYRFALRRALSANMKRLVGVS